MVSDHGAGPLNHAFFLNCWLMKNGYLYLKDDPAQLFKGRKKSKAKALIKKIARRMLPHALIEKIKPARAGRDELDINLFLSMIDWDRTIAFSEGVGGGIYINPGTLSADKYAAAVEKLTEELKQVRGPDGRLAVADVCRKEDIYHGECADDAPDMIAVCSPGYQVIAANEFLYFDRDYQDKLFLSHRWSARHESHGIFLMKGPGILKGVELDRCSVFDVAPTVLYVMGESVPEFMDGRILEDAVSRDFLIQNPTMLCKDDIGQSKVLTGLSADEEKLVKERLASLGYME
jgi:predicted AlkP superfamily phosphohydrolase/phosphomutase